MQTLNLGFLLAVHHSRVIFKFFKDVSVMNDTFLRFFFLFFQVITRLFFFNLCDYNKTK